MVNNNYKKHKEKLQKEALMRYQNISEEEKYKRKKRFETDIKNFLKKKKKKCISIMVNVIRIFLSKSKCKLSI